MSTFRDQLYIACVQGLVTGPGADWTEEAIARVAISTTSAALVAYCAEFGHDIHERDDRDKGSCDRCHASVSYIAMEST